GLEQAEEARPITVELVVAMIRDRRDPAHRLAAPPGEEAGHLGMRMERMPGVQDFLLVREQRRHPRGIGRVDAPGELQEDAQLTTAPHPLHPQPRRLADAPRIPLRRRGGRRRGLPHITATLLPTRPKAPRPRSMGSSVAGAIRLIRSRHEFSGTAGGITGLVKTP